MNTTSETETSVKRWNSAPRPLNFVRVRLYRGGMAEWLRDLVLDEQEDLFAQLGELRGDGKDEDDPEVEEVRNNLRHAISILKDINSGLIEIVGPDGY